MSIAPTPTKDYILTVDDNSDNLFLVKLALEQEGHQVVLASNGSSALTQIKRSPPALILLDVMMPGMDGYEVTRRIRQERNLPFIPILLITAHEQSSVVVGLDAGADEFIRKPVQIDELQARVRSLLRLKQTIDQRENFVSCLTHDLRTPLVAANRMLTLMREGVFGEVSCQMQEAINNILSSNQNMLQMLNTLLEVHHYEVGQKILSFIKFNLRELLKEVVTELKPLAEEKKIDLKLKLDPEVQAVEGDRLELRRVLTNLINNAIKFTDRGSVEVRLHSSSAQIAIEIEDTGIGIASEEQKTIFERYRQGSHKRSGKGLGLYLCRQIINSHQGRIEVKSTVNQGSVFTIYLPRTQSRIMTVG